ncbi:hypothetical protein BH24ACT3_BH24ACT3_05600 [soil metagenome]
MFARTPIAPFIVNGLTDEGLKPDLAIWAGPAPDWPEPPVQYSVGLLSSTRFTDVGKALDYAVAEQLRGLAGPFISLVQRDEHLKHLAGVPHLLGLLTTLFLAETGAVPPAKHWNMRPGTRWRLTNSRTTSEGACDARGADELGPDPRCPSPIPTSQLTSRFQVDSPPRSRPSRRCRCRSSAIGWARCRRCRTLISSGTPSAAPGSVLAGGPGRVDALDERPMLLGRQEHLCRHAFTARRGPGRRVARPTPRSSWRSGRGPPTRR